MQAALKLILASSLLFFDAYSAACESNHMNTGNLNKTEWTLSEYKCPRGCSSILKNLLNNQLGQSIDLKGAAPWTSGTADACQQIIQLKTTEANVRVLFEEINSRLPPGKAISPEDLNIKTHKALVVDVLCSGIEDQQISHRFIQDHSNRLISIDEETSVLIFE